MLRVMTENQALLARYLMAVGCNEAEAFKAILSLWEEEAIIEMLEFCRDNPNASPAELLEMSSIISSKHKTNENQNPQ